MATDGPNRRTLAAGSLVVARLVYAFNWYDIGPLQPAIAASYGTSTSQVSLSLALFLLGVGVFQLPAGWASLRWGPRRVSIVGLFLLGGSAVASALSPSFVLFLGLRFLVGVGAALFFSPALGLMARYYSDSGRGLAIGLFNGAFSLGAGISVLVAAVLVGIVGWQWTLALGGILMLLLAVQNELSLPHLPEERSRDPRDSSEVAEVLRNRGIWALALGLVGFWTADYAVPQYFVQFGESFHHLGPATAGTLALLFVVSSFPGGPVGGVAAERSTRPRALLAALTGGVALSVAGLVIAPVWALGPLCVGAGVLAGAVFAVLYVLGAGSVETTGGRVALSLGLINGLQVLLGSGLVLVGGYLYFGPGHYNLGWEYLALITVATLVVLLGVRPGSARTPRDPAIP